MTVMTETLPHAGGFLVEELSVNYCRELGTVKSGQDLKAGTVLELDGSELVAASGDLDTAGGLDTAHLLAPEIERESLIADATAAQTEADRLLALHKVRRDRYRVPVPTRYAEGIDLGSIVSIKVPRFGLAAGALAQVVGITENAETSVTELEVVT